MLIAGCGYVGSALGRRLVAAGHEVFGLRRKPDDLPEGVHPIAADLSERATLRSLPADLDAVVYTAGADRFDEASYQAAYVDGVRQLLAALEEQHTLPARILFTSSTAVYGQQDGEWIDEGSPALPRGFSGRCLLEGERLVWAAGHPGLVVRLGGIYGPGRTRLIENVRGGTATLREGPYYTNRIHRDDCARALEHLLGLASPQPLYLGVDCEPADEALVLQWLAERLGVPPPTRARTRDSARLRRSGSKRAANDRLLATGYRFLYPTFREGYSALLGAG